MGFEGGGFVVAHCSYGVCTAYTYIHMHNTQRIHAYCLTQAAIVETVLFSVVPKWQSSNNVNGEIYTISNAVFMCIPGIETNRTEKERERKRKRQNYCWAKTDETRARAARHTPKHIYVVRTHIHIRSISLAHRFTFSAKHEREPAECVGTSNSEL